MRVLGEPLVNTLEMKSMVTTGEQSSWLLALNNVKAHNTFGGAGQLFAGDSGKLIQLQRGQPLDRLRKTTEMTTEFITRIAKVNHEEHSAHRKYKSNPKFLSHRGSVMPATQQYLAQKQDQNCALQSKNRYLMNMNALMDWMKLHNQVQRNIDGVTLSSEYVISI